jgi:hypothetical protein
MDAIPARVGHKLNTLRERVVLRIHPAGARQPDDFELTYSEARRLAWALLADLAPDDIDEELEQALAALNERDLPRGTCTCGRSAKRAPTGKAYAILRGLSRGRLTARAAGELIGRDTSTASSFLVRLVADGFAERRSGGMFGEPSVYGITPAGAAALAAESV